MCAYRSALYDYAEPYRKALRSIISIYLVPRTFIARYHRKGACAFICGKETYQMYIAEDLTHLERLIAIAHQLLRILLEQRGNPFARQAEPDVEAWIDEVAREFAEDNTPFLDSIYLHYVRLA